MNPVLYLISLEHEHFNNMYNQSVLLNTAIPLLTDGRGGSVNLLAENVL